MTGTSLLVYLAVKRLLTRGTLDEKDPKYQQFPLLTTAGTFLVQFKELGTIEHLALVFSLYIIDSDDWI